MRMDTIKLAVKNLLKTDDGHGFDHVERVTAMAVSFAKEENADVNVVELASLLHDVDDYKIFGEESAKNLSNAHKILDDNKISEDIQSKVLNIISTMGYSKYLDGVRPDTIEGMIVSDADMCDAIGAEGILRTYAYNSSKGNVFFDKNALPVDDEKTATEYRNIKTEHATQHFFDKLLIINDILMTTAGKKEGSKRQEIMIDFLRELFREENSQIWHDHLTKFVNR